MNQIKKRAKILISFFIIWGIVVFGYLIYFNFAEKDFYLKSSKEFSLKEGVIPATRGSIYSYRGYKIAWDEIAYNVALRKKINIHKKIQIVEEIKKILPKIEILNFNSNKNFIAYNLSSEQIEKLIESKKFDSADLKIRTEKKRVCYCSKGQEQVIGKAEFKNGVWLGISGLEKKYNDELNGKNGLFSVMVDKNGKWVKGTFKEIKKMIPGKDLSLNKDELKDLN
jgi:stage V sporulation protein D (sporulation-specific penicillin-binding protein)